jgi:ubiquinone/menaquinone biosynthesis C-methylase UbiE
MDRQPESEAMDIAEEAEAYAQADFAEVNTAFVHRLMYFMGQRESALCLDLGSGPGDIPIRIVRHGVRWHIAAADISLPMLRHAHRAITAAGLGWAIHLVCADGKADPFPSGAFDIVFSNSILHHISETQPFWAEVKRVAKRDAFVLLRDLARPPTPEAAADIVRMYAREESLLLQEEYYRSLLAAYTPEEVRAQLTQAGLSVLTVEMVSDRHLDVFGSMP